MTVSIRRLLVLLGLLVATAASAHGGDRDKARLARPESVRLAEELTRELLDTRNAQARLPRTGQARAQAHGFLIE